jgi:putative N6-adenine-specific DNA methylase
MKKEQIEIFAATTPGLEAVCARELEQLGISSPRSVPGGVEFRGELREIYLANLWLRSASRVTVRVGKGRCSDFPELFKRSVRLPWGRFIKADTPVKVLVTCHRSRLWHRDRVAHAVSDGINRALGRKAPENNGFVQQVLVRIEDDNCVFSVDSSDALLHRRGYRQAAVRAPLRETLAAGILQLAGWDGSVPLVDPFCGSGSFPIEAGFLATNRAPGNARDFAFMNWPRYREGLWRSLVAEAEQGMRPLSVSLSGGDRDPAAVVAARSNAELAGLSADLNFYERAITDWETSPDGCGLVIANPPYGLRLERPDALVPLYTDFGELCRRIFPGWRVALLTPHRRLAEATGLPFSQVLPLLNGGKRVSLFMTGKK